MDSLHYICSKYLAKKMSVDRVTQVHACVNSFIYFCTNACFNIVRVCTELIKTVLVCSHECKPLGCVETVALWTIEVVY